MSQVTELHCKIACRLDYSNCTLQVVVTSANYPNFTATTSLTGSFEFDFNPSLLVNATLLVPANQSASTGALLPNGTVYLCADTATNKPPPFTLAALLPSDGLAPSCLWCICLMVAMVRHSI